MLIITCDITGTSPIGFSGPVQSQKRSDETYEHHEERTWREKMHVTADGECFIPQMGMKNLLSAIAKYQAERIPGKRMQTFTKKFEAGIMVRQPMLLGVNVAGVESQRVFVPSDGVRGGGKRVWKVFPVIPQWKTSVEVCVLDDTLIGRRDTVVKYIEQGGLFIGLGWFRPERNGYYGRYVADNFRMDGEKWVPQPVEDEEQTK